MSAMSARSCRLHAEKESHQHHRKMFTWHLSGVHDNDSTAHEPLVTHTAYSARRQREIEARRKYANQLQMKNSISSNPIHTSPIPASTLERLTLVLLHTLFFFAVSLIQIRDDGDLADVYECKTRGEMNETRIKYVINANNNGVNVCVAEQHLSRVHPKH